MQGISPTVSATTVPSASSRSSAARISSPGTSRSLAASGSQLFFRQAAMTLVHRFGQGVADARADPDHGRLRDAELHRDGVGGHETDAADVAREAVRVLRHDLDRIGAVGPEYPHRPRRADAVAVQEHHDLADHLLLGPGIGDPLRPHLPDAGHLAQPPLGLDPEHLLAERPDQLAGIDRADRIMPEPRYFSMPSTDRRCVEHLLAERPGGDPAGGMRA